MYLISLREFPAGGGAYWLHPGRVDIEQVEGLGLGRGWGGYKGKAVSIIERRGHLVEGAGGQVAQQALEAMIGIGGHLAVPPLPHHRAYGSRTTAVRPG